MSLLGFLQALNKTEFHKIAILLVYAAAMN
jgi:hypothetical protein